MVPDMPATTTPLFVTDKGEMLTSFYSTQLPNCSLHKVTAAAGPDEILGTADDVITVSNEHMTSADQLQGSKLLMFLPAGNTTCIAAFELAKVSA